MSRQSELYDRRPRLLFAEAPDSTGHRRRLIRHHRAGFPEMGQDPRRAMWEAATLKHVIELASKLPSMP